MVTVVPSPLVEVAARNAGSAETARCRSVDPMPVLGGLPIARWNVPVPLLVSIGMRMGTKGRRTHPLKVAVSTTPGRPRTTGNRPNACFVMKLMPSVASGGEGGGLRGGDDVGGRG